MLYERKSHDMDAGLGGAPALLMHYTVRSTPPHEGDAEGNEGYAAPLERIHAFLQQASGHHRDQRVLQAQNGKGLAQRNAAQGK